MRVSCFICVLTLPAVLPAAPWIVVTEIHYHPPGSQGEASADEFIEILNREPPRVDLTGWTIDGEVSFRFPAGAVILPGQYLVIARDPEAFLKRHPEAGRALGPFSGALDNRGGRITIRNPAGGRACEVRYGTRGKWPVSPGGTGHTLSLLDPYLDPANARDWAPSRRIGGTPGSPNFPLDDVPSTPLVRKGATWKYAKGSSAPDRRWRAPPFDDSGWHSGPSGFGYGDGDDATEVADMQGRYLALFTRHAFDVKDPAVLQKLILRVDYDDGFVAYVNGKEVARANMGVEGVVPAPDEPADGKHEAGVPAELDLGPASRWLVAGRNVIAVEIHNADLPSKDLSLVVELESRAPPASTGKKGEPLINEVNSGSPSDEAFIEIYNAGPGDIDLGGHWLTDELGRLKKLKIPAPGVLKPRAFAVYSRKELGEAFTLKGPDLFIALVEPGAARVLDAVRFEDRKASEGEEKKTPADPARGKPRGRMPDGSRDLAVLEAPTPGAPNRATCTDGVVINEILYYSPGGSEDDELIELHNRASTPAVLEGFRLTGAVRHELPAGCNVKPGGYLVVARNPAAVAAKYGLAREIVLGPYEGSLSARGEEIVLRDALGNVADRVAYADRDPWPRWADGLGSSLELIDPSLDNSLPQAWAASDSRPQARWESFSYTKTHRDFDGRNFSELQFLLLEGGECLIDDVKLGGAFADTFEKGSSGWSGMGTHERSGRFEGDAAQGKGSYRIVADGRGNARNNYVTRSVPGGLVPSRSYTVSFRAKWLRGSPMLLTRTPGQGLAKAHRLAVPAKIGTPGAENSARKNDAPPVIGTPSQSPVAPSSSEPVTIAAKISARSRIKEATLAYRRDGSAVWARAALSDDGSGFDHRSGDGVWSGQIPGFPAGKVAFYVSAIDEAGAEGTFPPGAPGRSALYGVGILPSKKFPTCTLLVADADWRAFSERPRMSNRLVNAALVYGDSRIFYNVGIRRRGSPFTRSSRNWRIVFGSETVDGRGTLTLDGQGGDGTRLNERLTYWLADQLRTPNARQQYVYFRLLGEEEGIYEDVEKIDGGYLANWFDPRDKSVGKKPQASSPRTQRRESSLHKIDDYWELSSQGEQAYREADFIFRSQDPEEYRWNFPPRGDSLDLEPLLKLVHLLDPRTTPEKAFDERVEKLIDVDEWLRVLAARTLADDWDTMGRTRGKNAFIYLEPEDQRWRLLPWDCDLAWQQNPSSPLFSGKFSGIERLLARPQYRRRFLGYMAFLAERKLEPQSFQVILDDLHARSGAATDHFSSFAGARRGYVLRQIPRRPFQVAEVRRIERSKQPDLVRATGAGPVNVLRLRLNGREGTVRLVGEDKWLAEIPIGPEGGELTLEALDFGGNRVASAQVKVRARAGATPLAAEVAAFVAVAPARAPGTAAAPEKTGSQWGPEENAGEKPALELGAAAAVLEAQEGDRLAGTAPREAPDPPVEVAARGPSLDEAPGLPSDAEIEALLRPPGAQKPSEPGPEQGPLHEAPEASDEAPGSVLVAPPAGRGPPGSDRVAEAPRGSAWKTVLPIVIGLGLAQIGLLLFVRLRRARAAQPAPSSPVARDSKSLIHALGSAHFEVAAGALKQLSASAPDGVPALLDALEDDRHTPFLKVRRGPQGLSAVPSEGPSPIRVRHVAALMLELALGKPPVGRPTRADWEERWRKARR